MRLGFGEEIDVPVGPDTEHLKVIVNLGTFNYALFEVTQQGADVVVTDPGGPCLAKPWSVDLRRGPQGTESVPVAAGDGQHELTFDLERRGVVAENAVLRLRLTYPVHRGQAVSLCRGWRAFLDGRVAALPRTAEAFQLAILAYRRAADFFTEVDDDEGIGQALLNRASAEHALGRFSEALDHLSEARRRLAGIESNRQSLTDVITETAVIHQRAGRHELAAALFRDALEVASSHQDRTRMSRALSGLGLALKSLDRWDEALEHYRQALTLAAGDRCAEVAARTNLGSVYTKLGEFHSAQEQLTAAVDLARGDQGTGLPNCRELAASLSSLGILYGRLGRRQIAAGQFEEALSLADSAGRIRLLTNLGRLYLISHQAEKAHQSFTQAAHLAQDAGDGLAEFASWVNLGFLSLRESADLAGARKFYGSASRVTGLSTASHEYIYFLLLGAELQLASGAAGAAAEQASVALDLARQLDSPPQVGLALFARARCLLAQQRLEEAVDDARAAALNVEDLRHNTAGHDLRASFLANHSQYFELWIRALLELYRRTGDASLLDQSLKVAERARARAFLDMLDNADIERSDQVDPELASLERRLASLFHRRESLSGAPPGAEADGERSDLGASMASLQKAILERRSYLQALHPQWTALRKEEAVDAATIRSQVLNRETAFVHSFIGEEAGWLWLVTGDQLRVFEIPARPDLEDGARRLLSFVTERSRSVEGEDLTARRERIARADHGFRATSRKLSAQILGQILGALDETETKRIVLVADGPLAYLPFSALPDPGSEKDLSLVNRLEWVQVPSVSVLASMRRETQDRDRLRTALRPTLAVIADPVFSRSDRRMHAPGTEAEARSAIDQEYHRLPQTGAEAKALAALADGDRLLATGFDATADLVRRGDLAPFRVVHFASHGVIDTEVPELSALVLSQFDAEGTPIDGFLRLPDIYRLRLSADLVVLSACNTALGQELRGEGLIGLTRGFMYAGASSVIASLWTVEDGSTRDLMERFYRHLLLEGMPASAALQAAQRAMANDPAYTPYHWAGFVLQGDWR